MRMLVVDVAALEPEDVVLGGGNVHQLETLPPGCRAGDNANAFVGGFGSGSEHPSSVGQPAHSHDTGDDIEDQQ